jgi:hypothetical protein
VDAIRVAVVNWSGRPDQEVRAGITALQRQLDEDFGPVWGVDGTLVPWPGRIERPGYWGLALLDQHSPEGSHEHDALSVYGHLTSDGHPLARVFVDQLRPGQDWTHLASHELLEMLVDPYRNAAVYRDQDGHSLRVYARRVCDPCADYSDGYEVDGHIVSDFVCPAWFGGWLSGDRKDVRGKIDYAFELLAGGSIGVVDPPTPGWRVLHSDGSLHAPPTEPAVGWLGTLEKAGWGP